MINADARSADFAKRNYLTGFKTFGVFSKADGIAVHTAV